MVVIHGCTVYVNLGQGVVMRAYLNIKVSRQTSRKNPTMYFTLGLINVEATSHNSYQAISVVAL